MNAGVPPLAVAQVEAVYPKQGTLSVSFPGLQNVNGVRVRVAAPIGASARTGTFRLPKRGDWGMVAFYQDDVRSGVWFANLIDHSWHSLPVELHEDDPELSADYARDGTQRLNWANGNQETLYADGSLIRRTHAGDPHQRTPRLVNEWTDAESRETKRVPYTPPALTPAHFVFEHAAPKTQPLIEVTPEGEITIEQRGTRALVQVSEHGQVSVSAGRDPDTHLPQAATLRTLTGSSAVLSSDGSVTVTAGLDPVSKTPKPLTLITASGSRIELDALGNVNVIPGAGGSVNLGGPGGLPVARLGDTIMTTFGPGTITGGSSKVNAT